MRGFWAFYLGYDLGCPSHQDQFDHRHLRAPFFVCDVVFRLCVVKNRHKRQKSLAQQKTSLGYSSRLLWRIAIERDKMDGTQIPTKIPSNLLPENHRNTEYKKLKKASIIG
jgi:hypothetical protein